MKVDDYLPEIDSIEMLSKEKEEEFTRRVSEGDNDATKTLVKAYLWLVVSVSKDYQNQGIKLHHLLAEGNLGLVSAARHYENNRDFMLITYAIWWINQYIKLAIAEKKNILSPSELKG